MPWVWFKLILSLSGEQNSSNVQPKLGQVHVSQGTSETCFRHWVSWILCVQLPTMGKEKLSTIWHVGSPDKCLISPMNESMIYPPWVTGKKVKNLVVEEEHEGGEKNPRMSCECTRRPVCDSEKTLLIPNSSQKCYVLLHRNIASSPSRGQETFWCQIFHFYEARTGCCKTVTLGTSFEEAALSFTLDLCKPWGGWQPRSWTRRLIQKDPGFVSAWEDVCPR